MYINCTSELWNYLIQYIISKLLKIKGLYITGQDIVTAGVGGGLFSGLITSATITGVNYLKKIFWFLKL